MTWKPKKTDPSALSSDPARNVLSDNELDDKLDELREHEPEALLHGSHDDTVAKAKQHNDTTPVDQPITE